MKNKRYKRKKIVLKVTKVIPPKQNHWEDIIEENDEYLPSLVGWTPSYCIKYVDYEVDWMTKEKIKVYHFKDGTTAKHHTDEFVN